MRKHIVKFWGGPWDGKHGDIKEIPKVIPYQDGSGYYERVSEDITQRTVLFTWRLMEAPSDIASDGDTRGPQPEAPPPAT